MKNVHVNDVSIPALGFGTYKIRGEECRKACLNALELGYRHFDTAQMYDNEKPVGTAVKMSDVPREEIFVVTKLHQTNLAYEDVHSSFEESLSELGLDFVDLLLIHAPSRSVPIEESIGAMNELQKQGAVKHIGVSNFSIQQLNEAMEASNFPIITNQVKYHPFKSQVDLLQFCIDEDIMFTGYSPLARSRVSRNKTLEDIGERYGKSPAQVALRWQIQQQMVSTIPKAADREHQRENINIFDFELNDSEMESIFNLS